MLMPDMEVVVNPSGHDLRFGNAVYTRYDNDNHRT